MLEVCDSSLLWSWPPLSGDGLVACQVFLFIRAYISVLVSRAGSLPSRVQ